MPRPKKQVAYDGVVYGSLLEFSKAVGISQGQASKRLKRGTIDSVRPLAPGERSWHRAAESKKQGCTAHGFTWNSQAECARDLGVSQSRVCTALAEGTFEYLVATRKGIRV